MTGERTAGPRWERHGPLRVAAGGRAIEYTDGTPFFWLGDTPWSLVELTPADRDRYFADRAAKGFTIIHVNATNFARPNYASELPFHGNGPPWSSAALNEAYWRDVDALIDRAASHGLFVMLVALWGQHAHFPRPPFWKPDIGHYIGEFFVEPASHNRRFSLNVGARYRAAPNIVWCAVGEYHSPYDAEPMTALHRARLQDMIDGIREGDGGRHLLCMHPLAFKTSSDDFDATAIDFNLIQSHVRPEYIDHLVTGDWLRNPPRPTLVVEGAYERPGPDAGWIQRYQAYWSIMHGSIGFGYGHEQLWRLVDEHGSGGSLSPSMLQSSGAQSMSYVARLFGSLPLHCRVPDNELVALNWRGSDSGSPLGNVPGLVCAMRDPAGTWAAVYSTSGFGFEVALGRLADGVGQAYWYNPRNGLWHCDGAESRARAPFATGFRCGAGGTARFFAAPGVPAAGNDWLLWLQVAR